MSPPSPCPAFDLPLPRSPLHLPDSGPKAPRSLNFSNSNASMMKMIMSMRRRKLKMMQKKRRWHENFAKWKKRFDLLIFPFTSCEMYFP